MNLITILMFSLFIQVSAATSAQDKISLSEANTKLSVVLDKISRQSKLDLLYNASLVSKSKLITVKLRNADLAEALNTCLKDLPLTYLIQSGTIIIKDKPTETVTPIETRKGAGYKIKGIIRDELGQAIPGATIRVVGSKAMAQSDNDGKFSIEVDPNDVLEIVYMGYKTKTIAVKNQTDLLIVMEPEAGSLNEVSVVGYGKQKKISVVGALTSIKPEELKVPTSNLSNAIAGKLAGVVAYQRTGEPGADGASFFIRGISTFSGATNPLIILDGVAISAGDLNALAPEVIESFSILKDATATAIYGTRGANGVMIVTTKSGKDLEKARLNIRLENSLSTPTKVPKFVDGATFMELYNEAVIGRSTSTPTTDFTYSQEKINGTRNHLNPYVFPDVDWYGEMFKNNAQNRSINLNFQGGGKKVDYFMSGTLNMDNGVLKNSDLNSYSNNISVKRYSFQNNINANLTNTTKLSLKLNTQLRDYKGPGLLASDIYSNAINANPVDFPILFPNPTGTKSIYFGGKTGGRVNNGFVNPYARMVNGYRNDFQSTLLAIVDGEQRLDFLTKGLSFKALASFKNFSQTQTVRTRGINQYEVASYSTNPDGSYKYNLSMVGSPQSETLATTNTFGGDRTIYFQTSFDYSRTFGEKHSVSGLLLYNQQEYNANLPSSFINSLPRRSQGFAGRATYSYDNKYLAEFNFGYNGSENFAEGKRFGFFPSAALGYVLSNEKFFEPLSKVINLLKFRGSWGLVGNDQIGSDRFVYLSDITLTGQSYTTGVSQDYTKSGPVYNRFANPNITWEIAEKINLGMDLTILNKLNLTVDVFKENRRNIFLTRQVIPDFFGTTGTTIYSNLGKVLNRGIDLSVSYNENFGKDFSMGFKGTFTFARNKVLSYDEPAFTKYKNLLRQGYPINQQLGYVAQRLFIDQAEINRSPVQQIGGVVQAGDIKYQDITGENLINSDDMVRMGFPTVPEIVYGFGPTFNYKKFDFSFFFQGVARTSFFLSGFHPFGTSDQRNVLSFVAEDHWSPSNPDIYASYPRLSKLDNPNNTANSSYWLRNGSFLKLRNIEMGYRFKFARVYLSGLNVLTFSKFKLWDPEQGGGAGLSYPTQRVFNIGLQMGF
ncbi:TonB-dependent receptor [Pedobacter sp. KR3-3]|uniref:TonB-dependent receptor n=1 Tax=Pedobacter albus TaxID=3113905 RepID=A0ABU7I6F1_9SPHI|nr:TonB-dependent receptor [Pedobacter sp. KR3-3]MEE1945023.1 TonB-dependent receptor [Pedobacter sp. KR3-3]